MKIYLASRYSRNKEMCGYATDLSRRGHEVTSRWILGDHQLTNQELLSDATGKKEMFAQDDWDDLLIADICVSFTEDPAVGGGRGGRHAEFGMAAAWQKRCIVVGHREHIFHCMTFVEFYKTWDEALRAL